MGWRVSFYGEIPSILYLFGQEYSSTRRHLGNMSSENYAIMPWLV